MSVRDLISALVVFAFAAAAFVLGAEYGERAGMFPRLIAGIMMGAAVLLFVRAFFRRAAQQDVDRVAVRRIAVAILATVLYVAAIVPLGYIAASIIFMLATTYLLGMRRYLPVAAITVLFVFVLHYVFENVFHAPLPDDLVMRLF